METPLAALGEAFTKLAASLASILLALMTRSPRLGLACFILAVLFGLLAAEEIL